MSLADDVKARIDIVELIGDYVPELKRAGRNFHARCPFHQERTPSFVVFPDRQTWRCFGACATGGDVFSFVMKHDGLDFTAALRELANRAGVRIPERRDAERARDPLYGVNEAAQQFFRDALIADRGAQARAYASGRRLSEEAVARFGVGYAPGSGDELLRSLTALGFERGLVFAAGLATGGENGPERDMFRGRLTFPLRNEDGLIAGFAGRSLDGSEPKYLNTPRTSVFDKGRMLYGLDRARESIGAERVAVVVEGYMDVIAAHEHGLRNVVASMGTALTEQQVALLKARAGTIILALDADAAGQEAMRRSLRTAWELAGAVVEGRPGVRNRPSDADSLRVAIIEGGKDPDELIRADAAQFRRLLDDAAPVVDFLIGAETALLDLRTPEGQSEAVNQLLPLILAITNWAEQERYLQRLADLVGVPFDRLRDLARQRQAQPPPPRRRAAPSAPPSGEEAPSVPAASPRDALEERVLALLAQYPDRWKDAAEVLPEHFRRPENRAILGAVQESAALDDALTRLDGGLAGELTRIAESPLPPGDRQQRAAEWRECLRRLEERHLRELKAQEQAAFAESAPEDGPAEQAYLDAVAEQARDTNERLRDVFARGGGRG